VSTHVVYTAWGDRRSVPLYVGCTSNIHNRMTYHRSQSKWFPEMRHLETSESMPRIEALALERRRIRFMRPTHNKQMNYHRIDPHVVTAGEAAIMFGVSPNMQAHVDLAKIGLQPLYGPPRRRWDSPRYAYDDVETAWIAHRYDEDVQRAAEGRAA
jgi:predicted GIY-YIG superfamily endonuclease